MVKISESKGKSGEGFARIIGNEQMGQLLSKLQSSVIRGGNELEQMLTLAVPKSLHTTLEALSEFGQDVVNRPPIQVVFKPMRPDPDDPGKSVQADILIVDNIKRLFTLVEVKDGYVFDTKKSDGELASLKQIRSWLAQEYPYRAQYFICAFNQDVKEEIVKGTKKRFSIDHVMTGQELCEMIGIDYNTLRLARQVDQVENRRYFFRQLLAIPEIRDEIVQLLSEFDNL